MELAYTPSYKITERYGDKFKQLHIYGSIDTPIFAVSEIHSILNNKNILGDGDAYMTINNAIASVVGEATLLLSLQHGDNQLIYDFHDYIQDLLLELRYNKALYDLQVEKETVQVLVQQQYWLKEKFLKKLYVIHMGRNQYALNYYPCQCMDMNCNVAVLYTLPNITLDDIHYHLISIGCGIYNKRMNTYSRNYNITVDQLRDVFNQMVQGKSNL